MAKLLTMVKQYLWLHSRERRQQWQRGVYARAWKHFEESGEREYEEEGYKVWRTD